jgi:membrane dipeptidase
MSLMIIRSTFFAIVCLLLVACGESTDEHPKTSEGEIADTGAAESTPMPDAAMVDEQFERARELHRKVLVIDAHADIELPDQPSRYALPDGTSRVAPELMRAGGVDAVVMSVAVGPGPRTPEEYAAARAIADAKIAAVQTLVSNPANRMVLARSTEDVIAAQEAGRGALILGFQNARILGSDPAGLDDLYDQGVRVFALTHMGHNDFADSSRPVYDGKTGAYESDAEHGGLSELGREAIRRINRLGGVVDVSQLSKQATLQTIELSTAPVIASHSNVQTLSNVRRNLSDEEIDRIGEVGGVIHVAAFKGYLFDSSDVELDTRIRAARREAGIPEDYDYPFELYWELDTFEEQQDFVTAVSEILGPGSIDDMLDHIDYIVQRIGVDHVGIGNDFNHGGGIAGLNDAGDAMNLTLGLMRRGYTTEEIGKIWGGNFLRVFSACQIAASG